MTVIGEFVSPVYLALSSAWSYFGFTAILFVISKHLWTCWILKSAEDPSSALSKKLPLPPGNFGIPFLGETLSWAMQGSKFNSSRRKKHGKIFSTHFLGKAMVKVTGAANVRQILQGEHDIVTTVWPTTVRRILGEHSISHSGEDTHKYKRKLAFKGFTQSALNGYIPDVRKIIAAKLSDWKTGHSKKIYTDVLRMTFEASVKVMLGLEFESDKKKAFEIFHEMIQNLFSLPCDVPFSGFRKALENGKMFHEMIDSQVRDKLKRAVSESDEAVATDVIQHMINGDVAEKRRKESKDSGIESDRSSEEEEDERSFTVKQLKQTAVELMFAGYMTTGSSVSSVIIQLANYPDVREKVERELDEQGLMEEDCGEITLERVQKLTYLEQVLKETLRVMPPLLGGYRKALKTFQIGEYRIPKGWTIIYNIRDTHEFEFEDDMKFNPDRFSKTAWSENRENRFKWLPFGGGPRICVGKEYARLVIKLTVIELLRNFRDWKLEGDVPPPMFALPALHPTNGLPVVFTPR